MRAPDFWWLPEPTLAATLLRPAGIAYGALTAARMDRPGARAQAPVICVGNLVAGGAGKTPVALALARMLAAQSHSPAFLSRGYGRLRKKDEAEVVLRVEAGSSDASRYGDEPLLLAEVAPTFVSGDRVRAARIAAAAGATVLVLDDGLQNPALQKDFSIAVVDGATGVGNGLCLPAGPLRASVRRQWPHVSLLLVVGQGPAGERVAARARDAGVPVARADLIPDRAAVARLSGQPLLAFAGIGRPEKFFATLQACGLHLVDRRSFPDHHRYGVRDLEALRERAGATSAILVTTSKDRVRLPADFPVETLPVDLVFEDPAELADRLAPLLQAPHLVSRRDPCA